MKAYCGLLVEVGLTRATVADLHVAVGDGRGDLWAGRGVGSGGQNGHDLGDLHLHFEAGVDDSGVCRVCGRDELS